MIQVFEAAVREVTFWSILATGGLCLLGGTFLIGAWALKKMLIMFGLYQDFLAFVRSRRRGR